MQSQVEDRQCTVENGSFSNADVFLSQVEFNICSDIYLVMAGSYVNSCCTSRGRNDFINELGLGALPELLNDQLQLLILLVDGA